MEGSHQLLHRHTLARLLVNAGLLRHRRHGIQLDQHTEAQPLLVVGGDLLAHIGPEVWLEIQPEQGHNRMVILRGRVTVLSSGGPNAGQR